LARVAGASREAAMARRRGLSSHGRRKAEPS
jgi:hypothetical protein